MFRRRREALDDLKLHHEIVPAVRRYYRDHIPQFISDWGYTFDTRNVSKGLPASIPFILFPRQVEFVDWILGLWRAGEPGIAKKSREVGVTWLCGALAATLCLPGFFDGMVIGFGSRKEDLIDNSTDPDTQFWKIRFFLKSLPEEFTGGWNEKHHARHMNIQFPGSENVVKGEAGDNIGRGGRAAIYFVDEAAHLPRPDKVDFALSQTTHTRIDFSSVQGPNNPFAQKLRTWPEHRIFQFHWRQDPRKDDAWYAAEKEKINNPVIIAQELDIDMAASMDGGVIPSAWIDAAVDAHIKLGIKPTGERSAALDVADEGKDTNAFCGAHGIVVEHIEEWSGKGADIFATVQRTFALCDAYGYKAFRFDGDGLGAGVRGDARIINEGRKQAQINVEPFRGSESVINPTAEDVPGRKNEDFFANRKAQAWWSLRTRFQKTYRAVIDGLPYDADSLISISSQCRDYIKLLGELAQSTWSQSATGKLLVDKSPDGMKSPNLADAVVIRMSQGGKQAMKINASVLAAI